VDVRMWLFALAVSSRGINLDLLIVNGIH